MNRIKYKRFPYYFPKLCPPDLPDMIILAAQLPTVQSSAMPLSVRTHTQRYRICGNFWWMTDGRYKQRAPKENMNSPRLLINIKII